MDEPQTSSESVTPSPLNSPAMLKVEKIQGVEWRDALTRDKCATCILAAETSVAVAAFIVLSSVVPSVSTRLILT